MTNISSCSRQVVTRLAEHSLQTSAYVTHFAFLCAKSKHEKRSGGLNAIEKSSDFGDEYSVLLLDK